MEIENQLLKVYKIEMKYLVVVANWPSFELGNYSAMERKSSIEVDRKLLAGELLWMRVLNDSIWL